MVSVNVYNLFYFIDLGDNEAIFRRTLSQIIRVAERTSIDRDCLAVIIRQQRVKQVRKSKIRIRIRI